VSATRARGKAPVEDPSSARSRQVARGTRPGRDAWRLVQPVRRPRGRLV